ncbi:hypothetical protein C8J57DRAFT_1253482 [Mycena rebaudengoi]|nr:hypothetical protein C8J57DRAFT_1253482 [Mycena rebaudengoi]
MPAQPNSNSAKRRKPFSQANRRSLHPLMSVPTPAITAVCGTTGTHSEYCPDYPSSWICYTSDVAPDNKKTDRACCTANGCNRTPRKVRNIRNEDANITDMDSHHGDVEIESDAPNSASKAADDNLDVISKPVADRKVEDVYSPNILPDHRGPYFVHKNAKVMQRDYLDKDDSLISPNEGDTVHGDNFLGTFVTKEKQNPLKYHDNKIYHVYTSKLKILDRGIDRPWNPPIPSMPAAPVLGPSMPLPLKRAHDSAVDDAFAVLSPSPSKKITTFKTTNPYSESQYLA